MNVIMLSMWKQIEKELYSFYDLFLPRNSIKIFYQGTVCMFLPRNSIKTCMFYQGTVLRHVCFTKEQY